MAISVGMKFLAVLALCLFAATPPPSMGAEPVIIATPNAEDLITIPGSAWVIASSMVSDNRLTNGIEISKDNRFLYVADWLAGAIVEIDLIEPDFPERSVSLGFLADNLRWGEDSKLWAAGQSGDHGAVMRCYLSERPRCGLGWGLARVNARAMTTECEKNFAAQALFDSATVAIPVAGRLWVGTVRGPFFIVLKAPQDHTDNCAAISSSD